MVIELSWIVTASDIAQARCCVCRKSFMREVIEASLLSDSDRLHLGEVCPGCIERGAAYIEEEMHRELALSVMKAETQIYMEKRALGESLEVCPSFSEFELLKRSVDGPRYASSEEAEAAWQRGEW